METKQHEFIDKLLSGVLEGCFQFQTDNVDLERFPEETGGGSGRSVKDKFLSAVAQKGFVRRRFKVEKATRSFSRVIGQLDRYTKLYDSLDDQASRDLLVELLKYRILGPDHIRLPLNNPRFQEMRDNVDNRYLREKATHRTANWTLNRYQLDNKIQLHLHPFGVRTTFLLEHYAYQGAERVATEPGDFVVDGGGCWGDTALYFADKAAPAGQVYCYEFDKANLEILNQNLGLNPQLQSRIHILKHALWDKSDETINYAAQGPSTTLDAAGGSGGNASITTLSIDDLATRHKLPKVDFIKMDVEGAELRALKGAEQVLRKYRPKLAISLYHKPDDLLDIPEYIRSLDLGYRFFLGHYTIHHEETVLFATAKSPSRR